MHTVIERRERIARRRRKGDRPVSVPLQMAPYACLLADPIPVEDEAVVVSCLRKKLYATREKALAAAARLHELNVPGNDAQQVPYQCRYDPNHWHLCSAAHAQPGDG